MNEIIFLYSALVRPLLVMPSSRCNILARGQWSGGERLERQVLSAPGQASPLSSVGSYTIGGGEMISGEQSTRVQICKYAGDMFWEPLGIRCRPGNRKQTQGRGCLLKGNTWPHVSPAHGGLGEGISQRLVR